jgi:hypothetical protein
LWVATEGGWQEAKQASWVMYYKTVGSFVKNNEDEQTKILSAKVLLFFSA